MTFAGDVTFRLEKDGERWWWTATVTIRGTPYTAQSHTCERAAEDLVRILQAREEIAKKLTLPTGQGPLAFPYPPKSPGWLERLFGRPKALRGTGAGKP